MRYGTALKTTRRRSMTAGPGFVLARTASVCGPGDSMRTVPIARDTNRWK